MRKKIETLEKKLNKFAAELAEIKKQCGKSPELGDIVDVADIKWIILDKLPAGYVALAAESIEKRTFGTNNDWKESSLRKYLNDEIVKIIEEEIGEEMPEFERNLFSPDGQTEYGSCTDKVSLISLDEYRRYRSYIPNGNAVYWWTLTPDGTKCNGDTSWIRVVSPSGDVYGNCYCNCFGVRPFCILKSDIFVSCVEE